MLAIGAVRSSATLKQLICPTCDQIMDLLHAIEERIIDKKLADFGRMAKLHRDLIFHCGFLLANRFFNGTSLPAIYFAPAALASAPLRPTRKVRPSRRITILSSRVSQPTAQSKTGVLQPTAVLSCANDNSPFVFSAFQMSPAVVPISLCMAPPSIATPKSMERITGSRCQLKSIVQDVENVIPVQNPYSAIDGYLRSIG